LVTLALLLKKKHLKKKHLKKKRLKKKHPSMWLPDFCGAPVTGLLDVLQHIPERKNPLSQDDRSARIG